MTDRPGSSGDAETDGPGSSDGVVTDGPGSPDGPARSDHHDPLPGGEIADAHLVLAAGTTRTAEIEGISAAGADPGLLVYTPAADAELLATGGVTAAPEVPASPTGCPTPAVVTRAARDVLGFGATVVDAGLAVPTGAPTVDVGARPGGDLRDPTPVPEAEAVRSVAHEVGAGLVKGGPDAPDDDADHPEHLLVAETIPGGTTTALGVLRALGEDLSVSSSLPENPLDRKRRVVREGLAASGLDPGDCAGDPVRAVESVGDPVLATATGIAEGALAGGRSVTLAGGTQMLAAVALLRHAGVEGPIRVAATAYVARDPSVDLRGAARALDVDLAVTDPGFGEHPALARYAAGEGKEGVGMGGTLWLADRAGRLPAVRERARALVDDLGIGPGGREVDGGGP